MYSFKDFLISEEYLQGVTPKYSKDKTAFYPIYLNPDSLEIKDLSKEFGMVRFIAYNGQLYVFPAELLHDEAVKELKLPISGNPTLRQAFTGVAKANFNGKLQFHVTNQTIKTSEDQRLLQTTYSFISKFFQ